MADDGVARSAFLALRDRYKAKHIAAALNLTPQAVSAWRKFPAERLVEIEAVTGIPREELRPDLFRRP